MHLNVVERLNRGNLPFVGREPEVECLVDLCRETYDAHSPRLLMVTGESGIGRSRLLDAVSTTLVGMGIRTVYLRIPAELSAVPLAGLLQRAVVRLDPSSAATLRESLRRLLELRPTVLLIDDLHLLAGNPHDEIASLLQEICDLSIPVIVSGLPSLARGETPVIRLQGLAPEEIRRIWKDLFGRPAQESVLETLHEITLGNPLAIRSALRGAIRAGGIVFDEMHEDWRPAMQDALLESILRSSVGVLEEGMLALLAPEQRDAARLLAPLGAVFSRRAAEFLVGESVQQDINKLVDQGILYPAVDTTPISGKAEGDEALAFSHLLLHRHLAATARIDTQRIIELLGEPLPLYSALPFQLLGNAPQPLECDDIPLLRRVVEATLKTSHWMDRSTDWHQAESIWLIADRLAEYLAERLNESERRRLQVQVLNFRIALLRREEGKERYAEVARRMLDITESTGDQDLLHYRIFALTYIDIHREVLGNTPLTTLQKDIAALLQEHPDLCCSTAYLFYLNHLIHPIRNNGEVSRFVESEVDFILGAPRTGADLREMIHRSLMPALLPLFSSSEGLNRRLAFLRDVDNMRQPGFSATQRIKLINFLLMTGRLREARHHAMEMLPILVEHGLVRWSIYCRLQLVLLSWGLDESPSPTGKKLATLLAEAPEDYRVSILIISAQIGGLLAMLRGREAEMTEILRTVGIEQKDLPIHLRLALGGRANLAYQSDVEEWHDIVQLSAITDTQKFVAAATALIDAPRLRLAELVRLRCIAILIEEMGEANGIAKLRRHIAEAVDAWMEWLAERGLHVLMRGVLDIFRRVISNRSAGVWRKRIRELPVIDTTQPASHSSREQFRLTMLANVALQAPDGLTVTIRGERARTLLGLMTLDTMRDKPFSHDEFAQIATGINSDPEHARRSLGGAIFRLREMIGRDLVITSQTSSPRLNLALVTTDLLEIDEDLRRSEVLLKSQRAGEAATTVVRALNGLAVGLPWPGLYQDIFESARTDLELRIRTLVLRIAAMLIDSGEAPVAGDLLRQGLRTLPLDEETAALLRRALLMMGRRVEAERIRIQFASQPE